jgi:hypothetical protein
MDSGLARRRALALIAAYAVALQMLLSAFVTVQPAALAGPFAFICRHNSDGTGQPAQHELPCAAICAALGHGIASPLPPTVTVAVAQTHAIATLAPLAAWAPPRLAVRTPQAPRGPPLA